jgi:protein TonB
MRSLLSRVGVVLGVVAAIVLHAAFLLFGGLVVPSAKTPEQKEETVVEVEDVSDDKPKPEVEPEPEPEEIKAEKDEPPPEAKEIMERLDAAVASDATPRLEDASLSAIEAALNGAGGGDGFAGEALTFASGGRIGGTGRAGATSDPIEDAFQLTDIDQKPRAIYQGSPVYPAQMRGKKVEGVVTIRFIVDANGKVESPKVEKSSHPAFEGPAINALKKWKFEPGLKNGERVASRMKISIRFPVNS